jgi:hypothetical protein
MNASTHPNFLRPLSRQSARCLRHVAFAMVMALLAGPSVVAAQETNLLSQTNDVMQADDAGTDAAQSGDSLPEDQASSTNSVSETNQTTQTTALGPDGRARRQRRKAAQSHPRDTASSRAPKPGAGDTNSTSSPLAYSAFRLVADRNIFDPNRAPRTTRPGAQPAKATDSFTLVGTLSYEKGEFAFFDGTSSDYKKAVKTNDVIAGYKIAAISNDSVKLEQNTNVVELAVGTQMRRREDGSWTHVAAAESYQPASSGPTASSSAPSAADNDVLMKLKLRREKE